MTARADLIVNGGFEDNGGSFDGWTTQFADVFAVAGIQLATDGLPVNSGNASAFFGNPSATPGLLSQTFATVANATYAVSYYLASEDPSGNGSSSFMASFGGTTLETLSNPPEQGFTLHTFNVQATGASTTLSFSFINEPAFFDFDDVSVVALADSTVPEPSSIALLAIACIAGVARGRRRSRRA